MNEATTALLSLLSSILVLLLLLDGMGAGRLLRGMKEALLDCTGLETECKEGGADHA